MTWITFQNFPGVSEVLRGFQKTSEDFRKFWKIYKSCRKIVLRTFRHFPIFPEEFRSLPKTSDNFRKFLKKVQKCWKVVLGTLRHSPIFPKISRDFRRFSKIFKHFGNLPGCLFVNSPVLFLKFSKEFPNIQQRIPEPLLPVTDRPLNFFMYVINQISNHTFSFNLKLICTRKFFKKVQI